MTLTEFLEKMDPKDNEANQVNANIGTDGTNTQYDKNQGNRGKQLNPNQSQQPQDEDIDGGIVYWCDSSD